MTKTLKGGRIKTGKGKQPLVKLFAGSTSDHNSLIKRQARHVATDGALDAYKKMLKRKGWSKS